MNTVFSRILRVASVIPVCFLSNRKANFAQSERYDTSQQLQTSIQQIYLAPLDYAQSEFKLFELDAGSLGRQVAAHLDVSLGGFVSQKFNDGECKLQGFGQRNINDGIVELILAVNSLRKEGAEKVTCIIPYFPYCQGVKHQREESKQFFTCFASDILKMLEDAGCNQVITFNSLMSKPKGFVNQCSFININAPDLFVGPLAFKHLKDPILVSSHISTVNFNSLHIMKKALMYLNYHCPIGTYNRTQGQLKDEDYIGESVEGRDVILYSTLMRSGQSFIEQSKDLKRRGARRIYGCTFHSLCERQQLGNIIQKSALKELLTTNSLSHGIQVRFILQPNQQYKKVREVSLSRIIAQIIALSEEQKSLTNYRQKRQNMKEQIVQNIKKYNQNELNEKLKQIR